MKYIYIFLLFIGMSIQAHAQQSQQYSPKDYAKKAVWIKMMDDPNANFHETEKAYEIYWQHHEMPGGENDVIGEHAMREKIPSRKEQKTIEKDNHMRMAVKKYEHWHQKMLPYVQADGRILSADERLKIWKDQQQKTK